MRDRSLDEFLDAGGGEDDDGSDRPPADATDPGETGETGETGGPDDAPGAPETGDAAPAPSTCAFAPDGAACAACGGRVERRWRDGDDLVCADCKEW